MRKTIFVCVAILFSMQAGLWADQSSEFDGVFRKIAVKLAKVQAKLPDKTVAVYGFTVINRPGDEYAVYATEKLTHEIVEEGTYSVIERSRIDEIMKEQHLSLSDAFDSGTASKIGKILSVDAVIIGTIRVTDKDTEFIARIIQSEKGIILGSADERVSFERAVANNDIPVSTPEVVDRPKLSTDKAVYLPSEEIKVAFSGLPGNETDWITLVSADTPDTNYGDWFYTGGEKSGAYTFSPSEPGDYEIRLYFNYPEGSYTVEARVKLKVQKK
jgi:hypothetical protein